MALSKITANSIASNAVSVTKITDNTITSAKLTKTGVVANTYGNSSFVPVVTIDTAGRITSISTTSVSGGGGGGTSLEVGSVLSSHTTPSTNTFIKAGGYYSKSEYASLASELGDIPDIGSYVSVPSCDILPPMLTNGPGNFNSYLAASSSNNNVHIIINRYGGILSSNNGINWVARKSYVGNGELLEVKYGSNNFVAVGTSGTIVRSSNGTDWENRYSGTVNSQFCSVAFGNNTWVAVSNTASSQNLNIAYSTDNAANWNIISQTSNTPSTGFRRVKYISYLGLFVAGGTNNIYTSPDGINWTVRSTSTITVNDITDNGSNTVVAVGESGAIFSSSDGITWTSRTSNATTSLASVTYANSLFVVVGSYVINTSPDGTTWTQRLTNTGTSTYWPILHHVAWDGSQFIAVGQYGMYFTSSDGTTWTLNQNISYTYTNSMSLAGGYLTLIGLQQIVRVTGPNPGVIVSSGPTAYPWALSLASVTSYNAVKNIAYGNGLYVIGNRNGGVLTSSNGLDWTAVPFSAPSLDWAKVSYLGSNFLAYGGSVCTSSDGVTWTQSNLSVTAGKTYTGLAYNGTNYVIVSSTASTAIAYSSDGITWTNTATTAVLNDVCWSPTLSLFIAGGNSGVLYTSSDGVTWTSRTSGTASNINKVIELNGVLFYITSGGTVFTSTNGTSYTSRLTVTGAPQLYDITYGNSLYVVVGASGTIYTSPDYTTWTVRAVDGTTTITGVIWTGSYFLTSMTTASHCVFRSADGVTWSRYSHLYVYNSLYAPVLCIAYLNNKTIIAGAGSIQISSDHGFNWQVASHVARTPSIINKYQVIEGRHYASTSTGVWYSNNGVNFTPIVSLPAESSRGISYNGSNTYAYSTWSTGNSSAISIYSSNNGIDWTKTTVIGSKPFTPSINGTTTGGVHYINNKWIFASTVQANSGITYNLYESNNLTDWTGFYINNNNNVTAANGAVAIHSNGNTMIVSFNTLSGTYKTDDGVNWTKIAVALTGDVAVSGNGYVVSSYVTSTSGNGNDGTLINVNGSVSRGFILHGKTLVFSIFGVRYYYNADTGQFVQKFIGTDEAFATSSQYQLEAAISNNTIYVGCTANTAMYPYLTMQAPLYSYNTSNTFFVPPFVGTNYIVGG